MVGGGKERERGEKKKKASDIVLFSRVSLCMRASCGIRRRWIGWALEARLCRGRSILIPVIALTVVVVVVVVAMMMTIMMTMMTAQGIQTMRGRKLLGVVLQASRRRVAEPEAIFCSEQAQWRACRAVSMIAGDIVGTTPRTEDRKSRPWWREAPPDRFRIAKKNKLAATYVYYTATHPPICTEGARVEQPLGSGTPALSLPAPDRLSKAGSRKARLEA